jgi:AcrR family transcriptional regulator
MTQVRAYRGVAPADRVAARREALLQAGLDCLHSDGLVGLTVRSICARSRLTARYFYESFSDREALLAALVDAICADVAGHALDAIAEAGDELDDKIRAAVTSALAVLAEDPRKATVFLIAAAGTDSLQQQREEWMTQYVQLVMANLPPISERTLGGRRAAKAAALFVMGGTTELLRAVLTGSLTESLDDATEQLTALWQAVLLPKE